MRILIDIGHPAHVHLFKNFAKLMIQKGHKVFFTCRDKEFVVALLRHEGFSLEILGRHYKSIAGKFWGLMKFTFRELNVVRKFKPNVLLSHGSTYAAFAAFLTGRDHISLEDTGNAEQVKLYLPFTRIVLSPLAFHKNYGRKHFKYNAVHEWAYLNPKYINYDKGFKQTIGLNEVDRFVLVRFVSWNATHDKTHYGLSAEQKHSIVDFLKDRIKIFISCEGEMPFEYKPYALTIPPERIHEFIAAADLYIGEGASMASECAVIGTPAIYINPQQAGTIDEQEKAGILFHYDNLQDVLDRAEQIITQTVKSDFIAKSKVYTRDMTDLNLMLCWLIEKWPESLIYLKNNPETINTFI